jgi:hypothetical protein
MVEVKKVPGQTAVEITFTQDDVKYLLQTGRFCIPARLHDRPLGIKLIYKGEVCECKPRPWWKFW